MALSKAGGTPDIRTTTHGDLRVKQRLGLPAKAVAREVANAYARGIRREKFTGIFRKYLDKLHMKGVNTNTATDIIVHGNHIYLFAGTVLVTNWPVPKEYRAGLEKGRKNAKVHDLSDGEEVEVLSSVERKSGNQERGG